MLSPRTELTPSHETRKLPRTKPVSHLARAPSSVGQPLSVIYCLGLPWVEVTGCNHKAKCPLAFGLVRPSLPGQWDALVIRISFLHVHKY